MRMHRHASQSLPEPGLKKQKKGRIKKEKSELHLPLQCGCWSPARQRARLAQVPKMQMIKENERQETLTQAHIQQTHTQHADIHT